MIEIKLNQSGFPIMVKEVKHFEKWINLYWNYERKVFFTFDHGEIKKEEGVWRLMRGERVEEILSEKSVSILDEEAKKYS